METKICAKCKTEKCASLYDKLKSSRDGLYSYCKNCKKLDRIKIKNKPKIILDRKVCSKCKIDKDIGKFSKNSNALTGVRSSCKACDKKAFAVYKKDNALRLKKLAARRRINDLENFRERNKKYMKDNPEIRRKAYKKYYSSVDNRKKAKQQRSSYYARNKHIFIENSARRRGIKRKSTPIWSETERIRIVYEKAKWLEHITGLKYHVDHIIPLNSKKVCGLHVWHNLQVIESTLNLKKSNRV